MDDPKIIHLGTTDLAGKGPGTYSGGVVKLRKDYAADILSSAKQFLSTARYCLNDCKIEQGRSTQLVPGVVCAAFACELALKWLIHRSTGSEARGHSLTDLYAKLNKADRDAIAQFGHDFGAFLERNQKLFKEARYHHEESLFAFREQEILGFALFLVQYTDKLTKSMVPNETLNRTP